jgi:hypothetical protein
MQGGLRENSIIRARVLGENPIFSKNFYSLIGKDLGIFDSGGLRENSAQMRNIALNVGGASNSKRK